MTQPLRLFLVEDQEDVAFVVRKHLERAKYEVTVCRTGTDALIVLGNSPFDIVLLDYRLPDMHGLDLIQAVAREGINTPVVLMTGVGDEKLAAKALTGGAVDYIVKDSGMGFMTELPKRLEQAVTRHRLQQFNQLLIAALESAHDGICITDLNGTMVQVNVALETMTGYQREELIGQNPRLFKSGAHDRDFYTQLWRTILARQGWKGEMVNRRKDGTLVDTSLTISPIVDPRGQLTHFVGIFRDITERRQLERQLLQAQKMHSVGTLAGGVAHEFNNLLAGIQGYAALGLREPGVSPALKQFLQYIVELSDRAANLTRQLLAFARKPALSRQPTSMARLMTTTAELLRHSLCIDVTLELEELEGGEPLGALTDANQLQQVLINLALNARDALTRPEPILFRMFHSAFTAELLAFPENVPPGDYVVLEVRDRGKGMPPEVLNQALDPFFTTKEVGQGTGLGLPVAFGIMQGHQGFLTIDSRPGEGTSVCLYLPRLSGLTTGAGLTRPNSGDAMEPDQIASRRILVVDDEQAVLDVVRRFLEIAGHRVTCVKSGAEAMQMLAGEQNFDLVILDLMVPREDGAETFRQLRQRWPNQAILLCTGLLQTDAATPQFQGEQVQLLRKPFRMNELWAAVNQALLPHQRA
jgi:two-component system, cell cycle sensor histidine kinase and response regulator CckA